MSLFGALSSGVSGLAAQSSAMAAISDNVTNVNTIGYKGTQVNFQTLVTQQVSLTQYSPGGVQSKPLQGIDIQGLLSATSRSTDIALSGDGFFIVNEAPNPGSGDLFAYTRAGSFTQDENGFLRNTGGFYLQAWPLQPFDGSEGASLVTVGNDVLMKAYNDDQGNTTIINDNIVDPNNLQPVNLNEVGGQAQQTQNIRVGANLPASDPIFDPQNPAAGGQHSLAILTFDSLGNPHNLNFQYTKETSNSWGLDTKMPPGAATVTTYTDTDVTDGTDDVYESRGQLEFTRIPADGETVVIDGVTFEFDDDGGVGAGNVLVDVSSPPVTAVSDVVTNLKDAIDDSAVRDTNRFQANGATLEIKQSITGTAIDVDASGSLSILQSAANINENTGLASGAFTVEEVDWNIKHAARLDFADVVGGGGALTDFDGIQVTISDGVTTATFELDSDAAFGGGNVQVDIAGAATYDDVTSALVSAVQAAGFEEDTRFRASGRTIEILQTTSGSDLTFTFAGNGANNLQASNKDPAAGVNDEVVITGNNAFTLQENAYGSRRPAVRFNADGTPAQFFAQNLRVEWANGAQDQERRTTNGQPVDDRINLFFGNVNTADGLTHLAGDFIPNFINQDGARFGNFAGVTIGQDGIITALFDNGETRAVAMIPIATFVNPNGMEALTGNAYIETDFSGQPTIREAGEGGAGSVNSAALESSTVDLGEEFTKMITTQRAYSAAARVITQADELLDELLRVAR